MWPRAAVVLGFLALTGCMAGPKYHQPVPPVPANFKEGGVPDSGTPDIAYSDWWRVFNEPDLARLETEADAANQDIKLAMARVEQAEAGAKYARSFLFPTTSLGASASRTREAQDRPNNGNTGGQAATFNDFQLPAFFSYEVDAWGRVRHSIESANAAKQATAADLRFVRLAVEANVAMDYYSLRETDAERQVLDSTVEDMQKAVDLTTNRFRGGLNSELEVKQAETLLNQTKAQAQSLDVQRSQLEHALAVLEGKTASDSSIPRSPLPLSPGAGLPPAIPSGLPAELLARRPDIAEVERDVAAANAEIGVAKTAALPHISLTGAAGFESSSMTSLFSWQNAIASLAASAITPLFTGGRVKAGVDQAWAVYRQSLAQYQKTVLTAYQEVEDQLAALRILAGEAQSNADAVVSAEQAETIALNRYRSGLVSYLDVVYAQTALLANQRTATQIGGERMVATVVLVKALGGGVAWRTRSGGNESEPRSAD
ncbi:RND efflux system, outer membrane lipoprotein, NodT family [Candidatus Sulfopaludibacter sp. SbA4]|nr:RND efflux system, outer membrane lipoprotein, NodT family [Candidatus Sulfopaludibacter sp. SbA4]